MAALGSLLRRYREAVGLSQEELAERAAISVRGVSDLERGLRRRPYPATMRRLASALELTPEDRAKLLAAARRSGSDLAAEASRGSSLADTRPELARGSSLADSGPQAGSVECGAYLGARATLQLVGRHRELAQVEDALEHALGGRGQMVLVTGEAGIGKTRLAQELAAIAAARDCIVATGRCYEPQKGVAFYPFLDALATLYTHAPSAVRESLADRWPYLERLLPDHFPYSTSIAFDSPDELHRLLRSATAFVSACAATRAVALLIDDVHWADRASIELLQHLLRHTRGEPVLIAATARVPELHSSTSLRRALVDLRREGLIHQLRLEPFVRDELADLLTRVLSAGELPTALIDAIHAATGGNPFFAIEVLQTLSGRGELVLVDQQWISRGADRLVVPDTVRDSILERFAHLSSTSAEAVDAAAVFGQRFLVEEVAAALEVDAVELDGALQEAVEIGLIEPTGRPDEQYTFIHALTHQALYEHLSPQRRRRLHLKVAETLEREYRNKPEPRAAELAHHFQSALQPQRALPYLLLAGDDAEVVFAHHEARQRYEAASRIAREVGDPTAEARASLGIGRTWLAAGRPGHALEHLEAAVRAYQAIDNAEGEAEALARIAEVYFARGNWDAGIERFPPIIKRLEQGPPSRALALIYASLAMVMPASAAARVQAAERAAELARVLGDEDLRVDAEGRRGFVLMLAGRLAEARQTLEAIQPIAEARRAHHALPTIIGVRSELAKLQGDIRGYLSLAQRGVARAEEAGDLVSLVGALSGVAEAQFLMGRWAEARRTYARAASTISGVDAAWYQGFVQLGLAAIDLAEGNDMAAEQQLAHCLTETPRLGHHNRREHALRLLACRHLLADQPAAALELLNEVERVEGHEHAGTQTLRAWALLQSGDVSVAAETVARAVELTAQQGNRLDRCEALLIRGQVERCAADKRAAANSLQEALELAEGMPSPYAEGRVRYARAELLADLGQMDAAIEEATRATVIFRTLGAQPYLRKADRLQTTLSRSAEL
jgi:tetratricopeptide (TPR) repeat protein/transcriptional regulator with XRE-family HTH domain